MISQPKTFRRSAAILAALFLFMLVSALGAGSATAQTKTLYERLGGMSAITAVVDEFVANVAADTRINRYFVGVDIPRLKRLLVEQICQASGGPCQYTGRSMKESHMGMGLTDADFNALVEDLIMALDKFNVPEQEKNELLALLGPMRPEIVEAPAGMPRTGGESEWPLPVAVAGLAAAMAGVAIRRRTSSPTAS